MPSHLQQLAVSPSGFVFDPIAGASFTANATALALLEGIADGKGLEQLVALLSTRFGLTDGVDLARDVLEFVRVLQDEGLLERSFELA